MFLKVFITHILLAIGSGLIAVALGFIASLGLIYFHRQRKLLSIFILLPAWIPPLFVAISTHQLWAGSLPLGFLTVAIVQGLMNVGLVALGMTEVIEGKLPKLADVSQVMGLSKIQFWKVATRYLISDFYILFVLVLGLCFF